jgi:hypothetical protein
VIRAAAAAAALVLAGAVPAQAAETEADVALVLAIDVSGSVDDDRFALQRQGVAAALESEDLAALLASSQSGAIEIAVVEWAEEQNLVLPWTIVRNRDDLIAAARRIRRAARSWVHTKTDPGSGIAAADLLFATAPLAPARKVIDVSGDGRQNVGEVPTRDARDTAVAHADTVNGLPITLGDDPHVDDWYRQNVVGGPGAFVVVANGYDAFAAAFRQKLLLEVAGRTPSVTVAAR